MKITRPNKKQAIIIVSFVCTLAIVIGGGLYYRNYQQVRETKKMQAAKTVFLNDLANYKLDDQKDQKIEDSLSDLSKKLEASVVETGAKNQAEYETQTKIIIVQLNELSELAKYSLLIGQQKNSKQYGGKITTASDSSELTKNWAEFAANLEKIKPPSALSDEHVALVANAKKIAAIASAANDAYDKSDQANITAQTALHKAELIKIQAYYDLLLKEVQNKQNNIQQAAEKLKNLS